MLVKEMSRVLGYYYGAIQRLGLSENIDLLAGIGSITGLGIGWAVSKQIRLTSMLIVPTMFAKEGRLWLTTFTYTLLLTG